MTLQLEFWHLVTLIITVLSAMYGLHKHGMEKTEKHHDATHGQLLARLDTMENIGRKKADDVARIEREVLQMKADLPLHYVRREDYIRGQSVIEAKLDAVAANLQMAQLRVERINLHHRTGNQDAN